MIKMTCNTSPLNRDLNHVFSILNPPRKEHHITMLIRYHPAPFCPIVLSHSLLLSGKQQYLLVCVKEQQGLR